jgi:hypothetical protein
MPRDLTPGRVEAARRRARRPEKWIGDVSEFSESQMILAPSPPRNGIRITRNSKEARTRKVAKRFLINRKEVGYVEV